jgi:predicted TIM-barrel fold metal-dependent hydrolase
MRIDVHSHLLSLDIFEQIESKTAFRLRRDAEGKRMIAARVGPVIPNVTIEERIAEMASHAIDRQVLSFLTDNHFPEEALKESPARRLELARVVNDYLAELCSRHADRFMAFADIPLLDVSGAIAEFRRAIEELGLQGAALWSNVHGRSLDEKEYWPFFAEADRLRVPVFLHPTEPRNKDRLEGYNLAGMIAFPFETTLTATRLVYSGLLESFKELKIILNHMGGTVPFLWHRLNRAYLNNWSGGRNNIAQLPTEYFKRFFYDTALTFPDAVMFAHQLVGDHIVFGTDYPYTSTHMSYEDEVAKYIRMIEGLDLAPGEKEKIFGANAERLISR